MKQQIPTMIPIDQRAREAANKVETASDFYILAQHVYPIVLAALQAQHAEDVAAGEMDKSQAKQLFDQLEKAESHLDYCGYGRDAWERECAGDLQTTINAALDNYRTMSATQTAQP